MTVTSRPAVEWRAERPSVAGVVRNHPVACLLLWFFMVGQAVAFVPVLAGLPVAPFRALLAWVDNMTGSLFLGGLVHAAAGGTGFGAGLLPRLYPESSPGPLHIVAFAGLGLVVISATRGRLGTPRIHHLGDNR